MMKRIINVFFLLTVVLVFRVNAVSPYSQNGQLHVCGTKLCNQYNQPIQLRGVGNGIIERYPACFGGVNHWNNNTIVPINNNAFDAVVNDWGADIIRLGVSPDSSDHVGYVDSPNGWNSFFDQLIDAAYKRGVYVLIDWHVLDPQGSSECSDFLINDPFYHTDPNNPNNPHKDDAVTGYAEKFFKYISQNHGNKGNVLYEIANEPNEDCDSNIKWPRIKEYAEYMIPIIRANDPNGIIVVGTEHWSQLVRKSADNPITGSLANNVMYTIHWYPSSSIAFSNQETITNFNYAVDKIPLFVTEWGGMSVNESDKTVYTNLVQQWLDLLRQKQVSWISWFWADNGNKYSFAYFKDSNTCANGLFTNISLTEWGKLAYDWTHNPPDDFPTGGNSPTHTATPTVTVKPLIPGDIYGPAGSPDGRVDVYDYTYIIGQYGKTGAVGFTTADITGITGVPDGKIDVFDYTMLIANYGKKQ